MVPNTWGLFETIDCLTKFTDMLRMIMIDEALRLCHEYVLSKGALKKGIIDNKLSKGPTVTDSKTEDQTDSCRLDNGAECVMKINSRTLMKPFSNQTSRMCWLELARIHDMFWIG